MTHASCFMLHASAPGHAETRRMRSAAPVTWHAETRRVRREWRTCDLPRGDAEGAEDVLDP